MGKILNSLEKDKLVKNIIRLILLALIVLLVIIIIAKGATVGNLIFLVVVILALIFGYDLKGLLQKGREK